MMMFAGCDVGSLTSKAVIIGRRGIIASAMIPSTAKPDVSAENVMNLALEKAALPMADIKRCIGTGYGRKKISFVDKTISEIACHARGARWLVPSARTIIDIGGQDCKAVRLDKEGRVEKFVANDKCASGTGRFLEVMAGILQVPMDDMGKFTFESSSPITLASTCTVWAQADIIKYLNSGQRIEDIGAGVNSAMAKRAAILAGSVGIEADLCMTGGVAKNKGVVSDLEKLLGRKVKKARKADPQLAGAIGAALLAMDAIKEVGK